MFNYVVVNHPCLLTQLFLGMLSCMKLSGCELFLGNEKLHIRFKEQQSFVTQSRYLDEMCHHYIKPYVPYFETCFILTGSSLFIYVFQ